MKEMTTNQTVLAWKTRGN